MSIWEGTTVCVKKGTALVTRTWQGGLGRLPFLNRDGLFVLGAASVGIAQSSQRVSGGALIGEQRAGTTGRPLRREEREKEGTSLSTCTGRTAPRVVVGPSYSLDFRGQTDRGGRGRSKQRRLSPITAASKFYTPLSWGALRPGRLTTRELAHNACT